MADLTASEDGRAQILLATALVLGILFVSLALILNSAIFTENLASRGETTGGDDAVEYRDAIHRGVGRILTAENQNVSDGENHGDIEGRVASDAGHVDDILTRRHARGGAISTVSMAGKTDGARINQSNFSRNFTDGNHEANWTVAEDVEDTRAFRLNVSRSALEACGGSEDCFNVNVTDEAYSWVLSVEDAGSGVEVTVDNETGTASCDPVDESTVEIDVTAGTVDGDTCPALSFAEAPDDGYDVRFGNGDNVEGTYSLVVDDESIANSPPTHFGDGPGPSVHPALYDVTLAYEYQTATVTVESEVQVAPGESDE